MRHTNLTMPLLSESLLWALFISLIKKTKARLWHTDCSTYDAAPCIHWVTLDWIRHWECNQGVYAAGQLHSYRLPLLSKAWETDLASRVAGWEAVSVSLHPDNCAVVQIKELREGEAGWTLPNYFSWTFISSRGHHREWILEAACVITPAMIWV